MNKSSQEIISSVINSLNLKGSVLEIGAQNIQTSSYDLFSDVKFKYNNLNIDSNNISGTIIADICNETPIKSESYDVILAVDVFEHLKEPWKASKEIIRLLKPEGVVIVITVWSWRYHPVPVDYWRFSHDCLDFLFKELTCLIKGLILAKGEKILLDFLMMAQIMHLLMN